MGYYTDYSLNAEYIGSDDSDEAAEIITKIEEEVKKMNVFGYGSYRYGWNANAKWYDHIEDMCLLSKRFPQFRFELSGYRDDRDDMWVAYFSDGKYQECYATIEYEQHNENKMIVLFETDEPNKMYSYQ